MPVHLCGDSRFEDEGDVVIVGLDVSVWLARSCLETVDRTWQTQSETR